MTLEQLLECDAATLEAMSDEDLLKHFQQYLCVTRPELAPRKPQQAQQEMAPVLTPEKKKLAEMLAANGVDLSFLKRRK